jgi:hypothetical protein
MVFMSLGRALLMGLAVVSFAVFYFFPYFLVF